MAKTTRAVKSDEERRLDRAVRHFFSKKAESYLTSYGANGIGFGRKKRGGEYIAALSVRVFVPPRMKPKVKGDDELKKLRPNVNPVATQLTLHDPETGHEFERIVTDVEEARPVRLQGLPNGIVPNARINGGESCIGLSKLASLGTLGGWAWDRTGRRVVLLSAAHVLGASRRRVNYPGIGPQDIIGKVIRSRGTLDRDDFTVDCAIATIDPDRCSFEVLKMGPAIMTACEPAVDQPVEKYGFATQHTQGRVLNSYWTGHIESGVEGVPPLLVRGCVRIEAENENQHWSDHGDSGSLVFAAESLNGSGIKPVIGLHFAGAPAEDGSPGIGIACPIDAVFERLRIGTLSEGFRDTLTAETPELRRSGAKGTLAVLYRLVGAPIADFIDRHEPELVDLVVGNRAVRDAAVRALTAVMEEDSLDPVRAFVEILRRST